jgi:hypothetical protein
MGFFREGWDLLAQWIRDFQPPTRRRRLTRAALWRVPRRSRQTRRRVIGTADLDMFLSSTSPPESASASASITGRTRRRSPTLSQKVSPSSLKTARTLKDQEAHCASPRVLTDFWTGFSGEAGTLRVHRSRDSGHRHEGGDRRGRPLAHTNRTASSASRRKRASAEPLGRQ